MLFERVRRPATAPRAIQTTAGRRTGRYRSIGSKRRKCKVIEPIDCHPDQTIRTWKLIDVNIDQWGARVGEFLAVGPALWKLMPAWQPGQIATQYVDSKRYRHKKRT